MLPNSPIHSNSVNVNSRDSLPLLLGISLTSVPTLSVMVGMHSISHYLEQLGVSSEEIFRGDRLPVLPFPDRT